MNFFYSTAFKHFHSLTVHLRKSVIVLIEKLYFQGVELDRAQTSSHVLGKNLRYASIVHIYDQGCNGNRFQIPNTGNGKLEIGRHWGKIPKNSKNKNHFSNFQQNRRAKIWHLPDRAMFPKRSSITLRKLYKKIISLDNIVSLLRSNLNFVLFSLSSLGLSSLQRKICFSHKMPPSSRVHFLFVKVFLYVYECLSHHHICLCVRMYMRWIQAMRAHVKTGFLPSLCKYYT